MLKNKTRIVHILSLFISILLLSEVIASADFISINTAITTSIQTDNTLDAIISLVNKGDEPAYNIQIEASIEDKTIISPQKDQLKVNEKYEFSTSSKNNLVKPGTYALGVKVYYTDANQYPFSALSYHLFNFQKNIIPIVFGTIKPVSMAENSTIPFTIKNLADRDLEITCSLIIPRELSAPQSFKKILLEAKSEQSISFPIKTFSALPNSTYQIFVLTKVKDKNFNYTNIFPGTVNIIEIRKILGIDYKILFASILLLLGIYIGLQIHKKKNNHEIY